MTASTATGVRRHPFYTASEGEGPLNLLVYIVPASATPRAWSSERYRLLLADLHGADIERMEFDPIVQWRVSTTTTATDFEHSPSRFADLDLAFVTQVSQYDGISTYYGVLRAARLWPEGVDPLTQDDADTTHGICSQCRGHGEGRESHMLASFLPPERPEVDALAGSFVVVESRTNRAYTEG